MVHETLFEKFIRVVLKHVREQALLKEFVRVYGSPAASAEAVAAREDALQELYRRTQEELGAPPEFVTSLRQHGWVAGLAERLHP